MTPTCPIATTSEPSSGWLSTRVQIVAMSCACAGATAFLFAVDPNRHAVYPQCLLYNTTGIYCAGCGATRACHALLHGRVIEALHDNALFVAVLPVLLFVTIAHALAAWRENAWPNVVVNERRLLQLGVWVFGLMTVFMVMRNLPGWPFDLLRPLTSN